MNAVKKFVNKELGCAIRVSDRDGQPWFLAKDICDALDFKNPSDATKYLDNDELTLISNPNGRGGSKATIISESGLYSLIFRSRKQKAKEFKRWVTHEVLPSIRQHGAYMTEQVAADMLENPDNVYALARKLLEEHEVRQKLEAKDRIFGNRTAYGTISEETGLPRVQPVRGYLRSSCNGKGYEFVPDVMQLALFE